MLDHEAFKRRLAETPVGQIRDNLAHGRYGARKKPIVQAYLAELAASALGAAKREERESARQEERRRQDDEERQRRFDNRHKVAQLALAALAVVVTVVLGYLGLTHK